MAIGIYKHCGIIYLKRVAVFSETVLSVEIATILEIRHYVRTSYGAYILSTESLRVFLYENIIIIIIIVVVTDLCET